ncbi:putative aluminum-activated malate transporter [Helianthus annuus]|nr:putative aluminum-activated malate transporter [Helianthus annuus]KAJ0634637.1 putative aluminum-activated malate transporter [Helianthus annuus]
MLNELELGSARLHPYFFFLIIIIIFFSLKGCVADYFGRGDEESKKNLQGYKCVLNSKTSEEAMANFARWEPAHGRFNFRHPWKNYLKIGVSSRNCAYCIETLTSCLASKNKVNTNFSFIQILSCFWYMHGCKSR